MTTTEALKAGRELDRMVAQRVFGQELDPENMMLRPADYPWTVPAYSTDIAAAWTVVEKLAGYVSGRERPWWSVAVFHPKPEQVMCVVYVCPPGYLISDTEEKVANVVANTAPEAICLAALKALQ